MRNRTEEEHKTVQNAEDMLQGCINRMCITEDLDEFPNLYRSAQSYLGQIFAVNYSRLTEAEGVENAAGKFVPVIKCPDCCFHGEKYIETAGETYKKYTCRFFRGNFEKDHFCSYGQIENIKIHSKKV